MQKGNIYLIVVSFLLGFIIALFLTGKQVDIHEQREQLTTAQANFIFKQCQANEFNCDMYMAGVKKGYIAGYLKGGAHSGEIIGKVLTPYLHGQQLEEALKAAVNGSTEQAKVFLDCSSEISRQKVTELYVQYADENPKMREQDMVLAISYVYDNLLGVCTGKF